MKTDKNNEMITLEKLWSRYRASQEHCIGGNGTLVVMRQMFFAGGLSLLSGTKRLFEKEDCWRRFHTLVHHGVMDEALWRDWVEHRQIYSKTFSEADELFLRKNFFAGAIAAARAALDNVPKEQCWRQVDRLHKEAFEVCQHRLLQMEAAN